MTAIYTKNNTGPSMVPCGTPLVTDEGVDKWPSTDTHCVPIHLPIWPVIPNFFSLNSKIEWFILSKAFFVITTYFLRNRIVLKPTVFFYFNLEVNSKFDQNQKICIFKN